MCVVNQRKRFEDLVKERLKARGMDNFSVYTEGTTKWRVVFRDFDMSWEYSYMIIPPKDMKYLEDFHIDSALDTLNRYIKVLYE